MGGEECVRTYEWDVERVVRTAVVELSAQVYDQWFLWCC
jgi:hypothetical protein